MNKVYKVIWSKVKNCYVVASELAKSHTKAPKSGVMSRALVAGVLACVLSCGAVMPAYATDYTAGGGSVENVGRDWDRIAIGNGANAYANGNAIAIGAHSSAGSQNSLAIGYGAIAGASNYPGSNNCVALGYDSAVGIFDGAVVSVGHIANGVYYDTSGHLKTYDADLFRRIINVADGMDAHDVVTVGQMQSYVAANAGSYTLPAATSSALGGVKIGSNITNSNGTISLTKANVTSALGYTPPTADTDTHYTSHLYAGSGTAANAATTNGNTKIALYDNSTAREALTIKGAGKTTVTSDANGVITITSTDANTTYDAMTASEATTGTGTTARSITAKVLSDYVTGKVGTETTARTEADVALGSRIDESIKGLSVSGKTITYTKGDGTTGTITTQDTNTTYDNMSASELTTGTATTARSISAKVISDYVTGKVSAETTARNTAISSEATTRANADTALGTRIDNVITAYESADTGLSNRIGSLSADGNYIKKSATNNVSANLTALDTQLKTTATAVSTETTNRTNADTALSNRIGSVASDGTFIKKSATNDVATNLTALDTAAKNAIKGLSVNGTTITYTKGDGTTGTITTQDNNTTYANMTASELETGTATAARSISAKVISDYVAGKVSAETTARTTAINSEATTRANADTALGTRIDGTIKDLSVNGRTITYTKGDGTTGIITTQDNNTTYDNMSASELETGTATTARSISAKVVSDYVTGKVSAETTARTTAINSEATTRANADTALGTRIDNVTSAYQTADTALGNRIGTLSADGNYIKKSATNNVSANLTALDTQLKNTATAVGTETTNRTNADTALGNRIGILSADGNYIKKSDTKNVSENLSLLDAQVKANATAVSNEVTNRTNAISSEASARSTADTGLSNRIGSLTADGNYIKKADTKNVSENLSLLDAQLKTTTDGLATEVTNRTNAVSGEATTRANADTALGTRIDNVTSAYQSADTGLSNRIGSVASDGTFIKKSATNDVATNLTALDTAAKNAIKGLSVSGTTITYTKGDGTTGTITTQDTNTTYANMTASELETGTATAARSISAKVLADYVNSRVGDSTVSTGSTGSTAVGDSSVVTGNNSVSVGDNSSVTGTGSVSVGTGSSVEGDSNVSIGNNGSVSGSNSVAIGSDTETTESNAVAVGGGSSATGEGAVSLGAGTSAKGDNSTALGNNSYSANDNSVALGSNAVASASDVVSVGHKAGDTDAEGNVYTTNEYRRIINVANGVNANDAATVGQMNTAINTETSARTAADTALGARIDGTIKGLSVNGRTITYTKGDGTTGTITTQDTTYSAGSGLSLSNGAFSVVTDGQVAQGNTGIVTGNTVYEALEARIGQITVENNAQNTVAVGDNSSVSGDGAVAVGSGSSGAGEGSVAVGGTSTSSGEGSVAVGSNTTAESDNTVAIGTGSTVSGTDSDNSVAIGQQTNVTGSDSVAVGGGSFVTGTDSTALGGNTVVNNDNSVALGSGSNASQDNVVSVGHSSTDTDATGTAYGSDLTRRIVNVADGSSASDAATVGQTYVIQNGTNTTVTEAGTNSIGQKIYQMTVNTDGQVISGNTGIVTGGTVYEALEARIGQITVENNAQNTVAVGDNSSVSGDGAVAVGTGSSSSGEGSVAVGDTSSSTGQGSVAVGGTSSSAGEGSVAVGDTSNSSGDGSVAVGSNSKAESDNTVVIGTGSTVTGTDSDNSVAIGQQTNVTGSDSVALGGGSSVTGTESTAVGGNTVVNNTSSVALGFDSNASQDNVVSVGHKASDTDSEGNVYGSDLTRRIVNLANGTSATDAATVGQTYVMQNGTNTTVTEAGTNAIGQKIYQMTVNTDGQVTSGNTGIVTGGTVYDALEARIGQITVENNAQNTVAVGDGSSVSGDGAIAVGTGSSGSGEGSVAVGGTSTSSGEGSVAVGDTSTSTGEGSVAVGSNSKAESDNTVVIGTGSTVTGTDSNNSVAIGQQTNVFGSDSVALGGGSSVTGTESTAVGGNTVVNNSSSVALGYDSNASNDNVVSVGHKATDTDSEGNAYGNDLTRRIINVADGVDAHDVVTVGQMNQQLATINNYNTTLDARLGNLASDGNYIRSSATNDVAANLMALDTQLKATDVSSLKYDGADHSLVTMGGTSGTKLTNLKQAALSATSTDAVTGAQLYATNQNISGFANDITQNRNSIREVNSSLSAVLDSVSSYGLYLDTFSNLKADASLNNLTAAGQQVIATAAANAVQEYMASQSATNSTNNVTPPASPKLMASGGMRLMSVNPAPADTNYVVYDDTSSDTITLEGQPGTGTKITNLADGELAAASTDAVTGSQLYTVTQQFDEFQSALSKNNTSIARAQTDINNIKTTNLGLQSDVNTLNTQMEAGMNVTIDGALVKNVNPESNYVNFVTGDNIALSNDNGSLKISAKSDGAVTNGNTGLVSGGTVYNAIQDALAGYGGEAGTALAGKANADASNIGKNATTDNSSAWGQALGTGTVSANDNKLVTGNTVYNETRVASDSNYIKKDVSAAANLQNLDTAVKTNADAIAAHSDMLSAHDDAIQQLQNNVASTASDIEGLKDLSNLTDAGKSVIRNLAQNSTDIRSSDGSLTTTVTADNGKIVYDLSVNTNGKVEEGNTGILTGDTVYQAIKDINPYGDNVITGTDSGAVGKRNTVAGNGSYSVGNDNTIAEGSDDIFVLGSNVNVTGHNSVVLGKDSDGSQDNVVSVGSDGHERKIVHVADGSVTKNSKDAVNGGQLYDVREDLRHANDVDVDDWSRKLGVGTVAEGDTGLVNGGIVYNALQHFTGSDAVTVDREYGALRVGASPKYDELPFVDFSNSQGAPRVLTGIATNIKDPSSAANVGYVNAVGEMVMQSVNGSLEHTNRRVDKVGAGAAAMSALTPASFEGDEKWSLAASVGNYRSATAGAVGAFYKPVENVMMNVRGSFGNDENMVAAGVAVSLNKGDVPGVTKRQLAKTVSAQAQEIQSLKDSHQVTLVQMQEMRQSYQSRFDEMSQQINEMAETIKQLKAKTNG